MCVPGSMNKLVLMRHRTQLVEHLGDALPGYAKVPHRARRCLLATQVTEGQPFALRNYDLGAAKDWLRGCALILLLAAMAVRAASPVDVYHFPDAKIEARYRALVAEFRCPKCLNTNLAGSDAPIAEDLRAAVHRLVVLEGRSDEQVRDYLQTRYGDFVLYDPPFRASTLVLWLGPVVFAIVGLALVVGRLRRQQPAKLDDEDRVRLRRMLDKP